MAGAGVAEGLVAGPGLTDDDAERPGEACEAPTVPADPDTGGESVPAAWVGLVAPVLELSAGAGDLLADDPASAVPWTCAIRGPSAEASRHRAVTVSPTTTFRGVLGRSQYEQIAQQAGATAVQPSLCLSLLVSL